MIGSHISNHLEQKVGTHIINGFEFWMHQLSEYNTGKLFNNLKQEKIVVGKWNKYFLKEKVGHIFTYSSIK